VLYQAGTSRRGKLFAGRHAEAVFFNGQTKPLAAKAVRDLREAARAAGRDPYDIRMFLGATVIVAPTRAEALSLRDEYARYIDVEGQLALVSGWTGIDLSTLGPEEGLAYVQTNAMQSLVETLTQAGERPFTRADFAAFGPRGARAPFIVGAPSEVADELVAWAEATDADGFNLTRAVAPETLEAFVDLVVPELQTRGAFKTQYSEGTLREKLFPGSGPLLKASHPGAVFRRGTPEALLAAS
jgi:alkanesulfonate monooxygenase SsuD/methylene tetrahydromethanopterin reductase-like flavin-dependent oxidoreductase (luciferase family)